MNGPDPKLFERLEPPRDGLVRLRARLERDRLRVVARRAAYGVVTLLLLVAASWIALGPAATRRPADAGDPFRLARIGMGLQPAPTEPLTIRAEDRRRVAAARVPLSDERVVFYRIATVD